MATFDARDHLGVNVHSANPAYSDLGLFTNFLQYLGVKWLRDDNPHGASLLPGYNIQTVITAADTATAVAAVNTAITAGSKAIELLPEPPVLETVYGASIGGLGGTLAQQDARFGHLNLYRQFASGMPGALAAGNDVSRVVHYSFKGVASNFTAMAAGTWDTAIVTHLKSLPADQKVLYTYYHEPENNAGFTPTLFRAAQDHFNKLVHDTIAAGGVKANVKTCLTLMEFTFQPASGRNPEDWWPTGPSQPDLLGVDFDGITGYPDETSTIATVKAFAAEKGVPWCVPEFGASPSAGDTSHAGRTAWNNTTAAQLSAAGAVYINYWDDGGVYLTAANELAAWKSLAQQSAAMVNAQTVNRAIVTAVAGRVPVVASALTDGSDSRAALLWGAMRGVSQGNLHLYRGNRNSTDWATHRTAGYALLPYTAKGVAYQISETGYHDYTPASDDTLDTDAAAEIVPDFQQLIADGASQVFLYEAIDEDVAFPTSPAGFFGLATDDWTPKPQGDAVAAYLATFVTGPVAPLAPLSVIAMAGDGIADVTWTPASTGTPADTYTVTPSPADQPPQTIIAPQTVAVFAGLTDGTTYTFTVVANNAQGSSAGVVSNSVTPTVVVGPPIATGGGSVGSIAPVVKTPFPAAYPRPLADVTPQVYGQVQQCFFYDPATADLLRITPNQSGIWLNDLDLGYPTVREVTASNPGRNGEYDQTQFLGARAVTLSVTVMAAMDQAGTMQPAGYWLEVLRSWIADPSSRFRLGFQVSGQQQRFCTVRTSDATAPFIGSGLGRSSISVQFTLRSPDGLLYEQNPLPNDLAVLQNGVLIGDGRFETIIPQAVTGVGLSPPLTPPIVPPLQSTGTVNVAYRGTARSSPEIRIIGACTDPAITALNPDGTARGKLAFTGLTLAATDELRLDLSAKTAIRIASGAIPSNVRQLLTTWSWFDLLPDSTNTLNRLKFQVGSGTATAKCYYYNAFA